MSALHKPDQHRSWTIWPCDWSGYVAQGPDFDAEMIDGRWVGGPQVNAPTFEACVEAIDEWFEMQEDEAERRAERNVADAASHLAAMSPERQAELEREWVG